MDDKLCSEPLSRTNISPSTFVPDPIEGWLCPHCMTTPHHLRAPGSYSEKPPPAQQVDQHFANCSGLATFSQGERSQSPLEAPFSSTIYNMSPISAWPSRFSDFHRYDMTLEAAALFATPDPAVADPELEPWDALDNLTMEAVASAVPLSAPPMSTPFDTLGVYPSAKPPPANPSQISMACQPIQQYHREHATMPIPSFHGATKCMTPNYTGSVENKHTATGSRNTECEERKQIDASKVSLVLPEDKLLITEFLYFLTQQLQGCRFEEKDRKVRGGKRDKLALGFGGLECRHCARNRGSRKFFWTNVERLANSFYETFSHIKQCQRCPDKIKATLGDLKESHMHQMTRFPRGSQKVFFRRMWRRIHTHNGSFLDAKGMVAARSKQSPSLQDECDIDGGHGVQHSDLDVRATSGVPLATASDKQWLSDIDCWVRSSLEVFCVGGEDLTLHQLEPQMRPIRLNQVGLRCIFCASTLNGATGTAVIFPASIHRIYNDVCDFQRCHLRECPNVPAEEKNKLALLDASTKSLSSISRRYYIVAARNLGMYDSAEGIFMQDTAYYLTKLTSKLET